MSGLWLIEGLKARMQWLQARQTLVSSNVANANTVGFQPRDLEAFHFDRDRNGTGASGLAVTDPAHLVSATAGGASGDVKAAKFETKPSGNAVVLEDEMAKLADIQLDYQTVTTLYSKSLGLLRMAAGGR